MNILFFFSISTNQMPRKLVHFSLQLLHFDLIIYFMLTFGMSVIYIKKKKVKDGNPGGISHFHLILLLPF